MILEIIAIMTVKKSCNKNKNKINFTADISSKFFVFSLSLTVLNKAKKKLITDDCFNKN